METTDHLLKSESSRRGFLSSISLLVPGAFLASKLGFPKVAAATVRKDTPPSQNLVVAYIDPSNVDRGPTRLYELLLQRREAPSNNRPLSTVSPQSSEEIAAATDVRSVETARPLKIADLSPAGAFSIGGVEDASRITIGDQQWLNDGVLVQFLSVFTAGWQWKTNDQGSFAMNLKFKEVPDTCPKLSKASVGTDFRAIKNGYIPALGDSTLVNGIKVETDHPMTMSFDFVDVVDETDKSLVLRMFEVVKQLPSIAAPIEVAAPYIAAGTAILGVLGQTLLQGPTENNQIWSNSVEVSFRPGTAIVGPRLKPGYYVVAGNRKNGTLPDWSQYQLRAADVNNGGPRRFLYMKSPAGDEIVPVDFSYVLLNIRAKG